METYFDISNDLKDVWDADIDPAMEVLDDDSDVSDWLIERDAHVVLHDRLMTDAALGNAPIKTEHSYSLHSDASDSCPPSPSHTKVDDMEDECYPAIPASAWSRRRRSSSPAPVKTEPKSEPDSPASSCPPSPERTTPHLDYVIDHTTGTIHMPAGVLQHVGTGGGGGGGGVPRLLLSAPRLTATSAPPSLTIKVTSSGTGFSLPPTPPSSLSSSDSDECSPRASPRGSPRAAPRRLPRARAPHAAHAAHATHATHAPHRQPIHTPLISTQPKGSTGQLVLTEEEKRTLLAEGYPVPTRLPLSKQEEKSLKKIRRKIKNKISAQESRRKKKEYMDQLERRVDVLLAENGNYKKRVDALEQSNAALLAQVAALQAVAARHARQ